MVRLLVIVMFAALLEQATGLAAVMQPPGIDRCGDLHAQDGSCDDDDRDCPPQCCSVCAPLRAADRAPTDDVVVFVAGEWLVQRDESPPLEPEPRRARKVPIAQAASVA